AAVAGHGERRGRPHPGPDGEGQQAVGDRRAEGAVAGPLDVDVDPLLVTGELTELVDQLLGDLELGAPLAEVLADLGAERLEVVVLDLPGHDLLHLVRYLN